jgi:hypothetical protein
MDAIGLADWFVYTHTDGRRSALKQTDRHLLRVAEQPPLAGVAWVVYNDVHGTHMTVTGVGETLEEAMYVLDIVSRA